MAKSKRFGFGRVAPPDRDKDEMFLMRRALAAPGVPLPTQKTWAISGTSLDQGQTGTCVGHAWRNFLRCAPMRTEKSGPSPFDIYRSAVTLDEWSENDDEATLPDGDPDLDAGTSVRAGAKAVTGFRRLKSYLWAFALQPAVEWVLTKGPVVLGTDWWSSFQVPDSAGIVQIKPGARVIGGHAFLWRGVDTKRALAKCTNSWSDDWGKSGEFYIPLRDVERLIADNGEACTAIEKAFTAKMAVPPRTSSQPAATA
jgi:hypothetical protein